MIPKIISDVTFGRIGAWFNTFNKIEAIGNGGTALTSLVEGVEGIAGTIASGGLGPEAFAAIQTAELAAQGRQMSARTETKK